MPSIPYIVETRRYADAALTTLSSSGVTSVSLNNGSGVAVSRKSDGATTILTVDAPTVLNPSVGLYQVDLGPYNLDPAYAYWVYFSFVQGSNTEVVPETIPAADTSHSLRSYRRELAKRLGRYGLYTTTSAATGTDAARTLIIAALADADKDPTAYDGAYTYLATGALLGQQRRVTHQGYTASTGQLLLTRTFASTPATGTDVEIHRRLPAVDQDDMPGLNGLLNRALHVLWIKDRLTFTGVSNQYAYSLTAYPWLQRNDMLGPVYAPLSYGGRPDDPLRWPGRNYLRIDANTPRLILETPFKTGDQWYIEVLRPADTWIRSGNTFGESSVGLVDDADEADPQVDVNLIVNVALSFCYYTLAEIAAPSERPGWRAAGDQQALKAAVQKTETLPVFDDMTPTPSANYGWANWPYGGRP